MRRVPSPRRLRLKPAPYRPKARKKARARGSTTLRSDGGGAGAADGTMRSAVIRAPTGLQAVFDTIAGSSCGSVTESMTECFVSTAADHIVANHISTTRR